MTAPPAVLKVLRAARDLVSKGWCQGISRFVDVEGIKYCAAGAIMWAPTTEPDEALVLLKKAIGSCRGVVSWNDAFGRAQAEVVAAFDRAIQLAEAAGGG